MRGYHRNGLPHRGSEAGFALPAVLLAMILVTVLGTAALQSSRDRLLAGEAMEQSGLAFYSAESGIAQAVVDWNQGNIEDSVASPGDSLVRAWQTLDNGCSYRVVIRRIDGGDTAGKLYSIASTGRGPGNAPGQRRISVLVREPLPAGLNNAMSFGNDVIISGNPTITGLCADAHANGDIDVAGTTMTAGGVSAVGTVAVGGTLVDTFGNPITPTEGASPQTLPNYQPMDYCLNKDASGSYHFNNGLYWNSATQAWRSLSEVGWKESSDIYTTDSDSIPDGVYCVYDGSIEIGHDYGSPGSPKSVTFLTTMAITIPGDPYVTPAHPDGWLIVAEGDVKLNGSPSGGADNLQGVIFGAAQCEISGAPNIHGQIICRGDSDPLGSQNWVPETKISGDLTLKYDCEYGAPSSGKPAAISGWSWTQILG